VEAPGFKPGEMEGKRGRSAIESHVPLAKKAAEKSGLTNVCRRLKPAQKGNKRLIGTTEVVP
jgi:hypothetical protein